MSNVKIEPGQMWEFGGDYYVVMRPHEKYSDGWYLFCLRKPDDTHCWDYGKEIINSFTLVA